MSIEVQIDGYHEVVIAIIGCRDGYFGSVGFSKELLDQVITTQVALPILCVRCAWSERERERERERYREREREIDGSDVTLVALKLAMSFALSMPKIAP